MHAILTTGTVYSDSGLQDLPQTLEVRLDTTSQDCCPVSFYVEGKPVFTMGSDEIDAFCDFLKQFNPRP